MNLSTTCLRYWKFVSVMHCSPSSSSQYGRWQLPHAAALFEQTNDDDVIIDDPNPALFCDQFGSCATELFTANGSGCDGATWCLVCNSFWDMEVWTAGRMSFVRAVTHVVPPVMVGWSPCVVCTLSSRCRSFFKSLNRCCCCLIVCKV